jgi:hypothetical protein
MLVAITGDDTLTLGGNTFTDFADNEVSKVEPPNDIVKVKTGKNQNTIYAKDETGNNFNVTLRLLRGSPDDQFLQNQYQAMVGNFAATILLNGTFVKNLGDGAGNISRDIYTLKGGVIVRLPAASENAEGNTDQAVSIWSLKFALGSRAIG